MGRTGSRARRPPTWSAGRPSTCCAPTARSVADALLLTGLPVLRRVRLLPAQSAGCCRGVSAHVPPPARPPWEHPHVPHPPARRRPQRRRRPPRRLAAARRRPAAPVRRRAAPAPRRHRPARRRSTSSSSTTRSRCSPARSTTPAGPARRPARRRRAWRRGHPRHRPGRRPSTTTHTEPFHVVQGRRHARPRQRAAAPAGRSAGRPHRRGGRASSAAGRPARGRRCGRGRRGRRGRRPALGQLGGRRRDPRRRHQPVRRPRPSCTTSTSTASHFAVTGPVDHPAAPAGPAAGRRPGRLRRVAAASPPGTPTWSGSAPRDVAEEAREPAGCGCGPLPPRPAATPATCAVLVDASS